MGTDWRERWGSDKRCRRSVGPGILNHCQSLPRVHKHQHSHRSKTSLSYQVAYHTDQVSGALTNTSAAIGHSLLHTQTRETKKMGQGEMDREKLSDILMNIREPVVENIAISKLD